MFLETIQNILKLHFKKCRFKVLINTKRTDSHAFYVQIINISLLIQYLKIDRFKTVKHK